jgi:hypothetical protein
VLGHAARVEREAGRDPGREQPLDRVVPAEGRDPAVDRGVEVVVRGAAAREFL